MQLSPHFSLAEFTKSYTATRLGLPNVPTQVAINNLTLLCEKVLEPVRAHFGKPIIINSGYRSFELNQAVGGKANSQHRRGEACDLEIAGVPNRELAEWIRDHLDFDQVIEEFCKADDPSAGWIHVSYSSKRNRKQYIKIGDK